LRQIFQRSAFRVRVLTVPYRPAWPVSPHRPLETSVTGVTSPSPIDQRDRCHLTVPYRPVWPVSIHSLRDEMTVNFIFLCLILIGFNSMSHEGTRYRSWLRHYATSRKVAAALYPQEDSWYSFLLEAESTPGL
jgi:hypothetical protein